MKKPKKKKRQAKNITEYFFSDEHGLLKINESVILKHYLDYTEVMKHAYA